MKTYVAMYRLPDGRQVAVHISDTRLECALARARWRAMAVALEHGLPWPGGVELVGIEEQQDDTESAGLARAAVLAARLAGTRSEAHRLVDAALEIVAYRSGVALGLN